MGTFSHGGIGIATVLAVSGSVMFLAFRTSSLVLNLAFIKQLSTALYVHQARAIYYLPTVFLPSSYSGFLCQVKAITTPSREAIAQSQDSHYSIDARLASPPSVLTSGQSSPKKKKKVRFAASVMEPKGDNKEYRRNPKSSRSQPTEQSMSDFICDYIQADGEEEDIETGLASPSKPFFSAIW